MVTIKSTFFTRFPQIIIIIFSLLNFYVFFQDYLTGEMIVTHDSRQYLSTYALAYNNLFSPNMTLWDIRLNSGDKFWIYQDLFNVYDPVALVVYFLAYHLKSDINLPFFILTSVWMLIFSIGCYFLSRQYFENKYFNLLIFYLALNGPIVINIVAQISLLMPFRYYPFFLIFINLFIKHKDIKFLYYSIIILNINHCGYQSVFLVPFLLIIAFPVLTILISHKWKTTQLLGLIVFLLLTLLYNFNGILFFKELKSLYPLLRDQIVTVFFVYYHNLIFSFFKSSFNYSSWHGTPYTNLLLQLIGLIYLLFTSYKRKYLFVKNNSFVILNFLIALIISHGYFYIKEYIYLRGDFFHIRNWGFVITIFKIYSFVLITLICKEIIENDIFKKISFTKVIVTMSSLLIIVFLYLEKFYEIDEINGNLQRVLAFIPSHLFRLWSISQDSFTNFVQQLYYFIQEDYLVNKNIWIYFLDFTLGFISVFFLSIYFKPKFIKRNSYYCMLFCLIILSNIFYIQTTEVLNKGQYRAEKNTLAFPFPPYSFKEYRDVLYGDSESIYDDDYYIEMYSNIMAGITHKQPFIPVLQHDLLSSIPNDSDRTKYYGVSTPTYGVINDYCELILNQKGERHFFSDRYLLERYLETKKTHFLEKNCISSEVSAAARIHDFNFSNDQIQLKLDIPQDGLFYIRDNWDNRWEAKNGNETLIIHHFDVAFKAILLKKGSHSLQLNYNFTLYKIALMIKFILFITLLMYIVVTLSSAIFSRKAKIIKFAD